MLFYCQILLNFQSAQALIQVRSLSYLDVSSRVRIFPNGFEDGKMYTIYFDNFTKTIVKVKTSS